MALLNILRYPNPRLNLVAKPVKKVDERIRQLVADMAETMYQANGIGLAATQVDVHERVVVMDLSESRDQLQVLINPVILERSGETVYEEGCLSVPGVYDKVTRSETIVAEALDADGQPYTIHADGLQAICIQHEIDHLDGKVFVQYLSRLKQERIKTKMRKLDKHTL